MLAVHLLRNSSSLSVAIVDRGRWRGAASPTAALIDFTFSTYPQAR